MKHSYESDVLFKLMERDGLNIPSSVPPYEAEIKAYLINQVKQAYPKLTDYEAEWLLYNYTKHIPAEFPISSVTDVTSATFKNVVPYAYKSAILTGQTLVNLLTQESSTNMYTTRTQIDGGYRYTQQYNANMSATRFQWDVTNNGHNRLKPNTKYYVQFTVKVNKGRDVRVVFEGSGGDGYATALAENSTTTIKCSVLCGESLKRFFVYIVPPLDESYTDDTFDILDFMTIEYQDGMENWEIPYFEGMQSVRMPVLTSSNLGNLISINDLEQGGLFNTNGAPTNFDFIRSDFIEVTHDEYTLSHNSLAWTKIFEYDENKEFIRLTNTRGDRHTTEVTENTKYIRFSIELSFSQVNSLNISLCPNESTNKLPFKSNILTVNEDVTLRGIGGVQDTLDCLTGEVTERIGEIVLDGSERWEYHLQTNTNTIAYRTPVTGTSPYSPLLCDRFINQTGTADTEHCFIGSSSFAIFIDRSRLSTVSITGFKEYLQSNPLTIQYRLANESIKTVDLKCTDQNGNECYLTPIEGTMNVSTSGQPIQPKLDMAVPVEATTQNLASFIDLEIEGEQDE